MCRHNHGSIPSMDRHLGATIYPVRYMIIHMCIIYQKRFGSYLNTTLRASGAFRAFSGILGRARFERYSAPVSGLLGCPFGASFSALLGAFSCVFPAFFQVFCWVPYVFPAFVHVFCYFRHCPPTSCFYCSAARFEC